MITRLAFYTEGAPVSLRLQRLQELNAALLQLLILQCNQFVLSQAVALNLALGRVFGGLFKLLGFHI